MGRNLKGSVKQGDSFNTKNSQNKEHKLERITTGEIFLAGVVLASSYPYGEFSIKTNNGYDEYETKINRKIERNNKIEKFNGITALVSKRGDSYFVDIFGNTLRMGNDAPTLNIFTYKIDENTFQTIGKVNELQLVEDAYQILENITKENLHSVLELGDLKELYKKTRKHTKNPYSSILTITKPVLNVETNKVEFYIQTLEDFKISEDKDGKVKVKSFTVSQPLNEKIELMPVLAVNNYLLDKAEVKLERDWWYDLDNINVIQNKKDLEAKKKANSKSR